MAATCRALEAGHLGPWTDGSAAGLAATAGMGAASSGPWERSSA